MSKQKLTKNFQKNETWLEVDGKKILIEDPALFNRVNSLAEYNAALGNSNPRLFGNLLAYNQRLSKQEQAEDAEALRKQAKKDYEDVQSARFQDWQQANQNTPKQEPKPKREMSAEEKHWDNSYPFWIDG